MLQPIRQKNHNLAKPAVGPYHCTGRLRSNSPTTQPPLIGLGLLRSKFPTSANDCVFWLRKDLLAKPLVESTLAAQPWCRKSPSAFHVSQIRLISKLQSHESTKIHVHKLNSTISQNRQSCNRGETQLLVGRRIDK